MKKTKNIRKTDELGRIAIPKEFIKKLQIKEGTSFRFTLYENGSIILDPYPSKSEKIEKWLSSVFSIMSKDTCEIDFHFYGSAVVCTREDDYPRFIDTIGIAVCSPEDEFNINIGKCIAYSRAANIEIPDFIMKD